MTSANCSGMRAKRIRHWNEWIVCQTCSYSHDNVSNDSYPILNDNFIYVSDASLLLCPNVISEHTSHAHCLSEIIRTFKFISQYKHKHLYTNCKAGKNIATSYPGGAQYLLRETKESLPTPCWGRGMTHRQPFRTFCESSGSRSPQVRYPGQVKWLNLKKIAICYCHGDRDNDSRLSEVDIPTA